MGGTAILIAMWAGYLVAVLVELVHRGGGPTASAWLLLYLTTGHGIWSASSTTSSRSASSATSG